MRSQDLPNTALRLKVELDTMNDLPQGTKTIITTITQHPHLKTSTRSIKSQ
jgi:hypothetical protein